MSGVIRKKVQRKFKMGGYTLKVEALNEVLSFLTHFQDVQDEALDLLLDQLQHQSLKSSILDKEPLHSVVSLLLEADGESPNSSNSNSSSSSSSPAALRIIDAFLIPKFRYDPVRKIFFDWSHGIGGDLPPLITADYCRPSIAAVPPPHRRFAAVHCPSFPSPLSFLPIAVVPPFHHCCLSVVADCSCLSL